MTEQGKAVIRFGEIQELVKGKNQLHAKLKDEQDKLKVLFNQLGVELNDNRIDSDQLNPLYTQIDNLKKEIKKMESEIGEPQK